VQEKEKGKRCRRRDNGVTALGSSCDARFQLGNLLKIALNFDRGSFDQDQHARGAAP
jgi:hypothetical protein